MKSKLLKLSLLLAFTNIAIASIGYEDQRSMKIPTFSPISLTEIETKRECIVKPTLNFLGGLETRSNTQLSSKLAQIHLESNCFEISINPSKFETKETYAQTDNISTKTDLIECKDETTLYKLLSNLSSV